MVVVVVQFNVYSYNMPRIEVSKEVANVNFIIMKMLIVLQKVFVCCKMWFCTECTTVVSSETAASIIVCAGML